MRERYHRLPAINILPDEYRRRYLSRLEWILILALLVALALLTASPSSLQRLAEERRETAALQAEERRLDTATSELEPQIWKADELRDEILSLQATLDKTRQVREALAGQRLNWDALLSAVLVAPPAGIELTSVVGNPNQLAIEGMSYEGFGAFEQYYNRLNVTPGVSRVSITKTETREDEQQGRSVVFSLTVDLEGD